MYALKNILYLKKKSLFFQPDFFMLWVGQAVSQLGDGLNRVALLWFVYKLTGQASAMAIIGILQTIPVLCISLMAGPYLDRFNKKHAMIYIDLCRFILMMFIPILYHFKMLNFIVLCTLVLFISCFSVLFGPALTSTIPFIVSKDRYREANGLIQSTGQLGMIFGPALSGLLIPVLSAPNILFIDAATFLISAICIIPLSFHQENYEHNKIKLVQEIKTGIAFIFRNKNILNILLLILIFNFFITSLPIIYSFLSKNILEDGAKSMGFLMAGFGIGALLSSLINGYIKTKSNEQKVIKCLLIIVGFAFIFISKHFFLRYALSASIVIGICASAITIMYVTLIQLETPKNMLSRTFTSFAMLIHISTVIGMLVTGYMLDIKGVILTLFIFGIIIISLTTILVLKYEFFNNYGRILSDLNKIKNILKSYIKQITEKAIIFLNNSGCEVYILEENCQNCKKNAQKNSKTKFQGPKIKNFIGNLLNKLNAVTENNDSESGVDVMGWTLFISYMLLIIVVCI